LMLPPTLLTRCVCSVTCHSSLYPVLSLIRLRPPRPTLFPYTTLFRSDERYAMLGEDIPRTECLKDVVTRLIPYWYDNIVPQLVTDRKSTRLNSSHVSISYAVFCLKKKRKRRFIHGHNR